MLTKIKSIKLTLQKLRNLENGIVTKVSKDDFKKMEYKLNVTIQSLDDEIDNLHDNSSMIKENNKLKISDAYLGNFVIRSFLDVYVQNYINLFAESLYLIEK